MGEKRIKKILDFTCKYCGKKYNMEDLEQEGYIDNIKLGKVVTCKSPKCNAEQLIE